MLLGVLSQTLAGFSHGLEFYRTDKQGRMFDKYGERIYQEGEVQTEESSEEEEVELGVEKLPEDDSDDKKNSRKGSTIKIRFRPKTWGMLLGVSGQTLVGFSRGLEFYRTDKQGRMFE